MVGCIAFLDHNDKKPDYRCPFDGNGTESEKRRVDGNENLYKV